MKRRSLLLGTASVLIGTGGAGALLSDSPANDDPLEASSTSDDRSALHTTSSAPTSASSDDSSGDSATRDDATDGKIAPSASISADRIIGESVVLSPGETSRSRVVVDGDDHTIVTLFEPVEGDVSVRVDDPGLIPPPDSVYLSQPPGWYWEDEQTVEIPLVVTAPENAPTGSYSFRVSVVQPNFGDESPRKPKTSVEGLAQSRVSRSFDIRVA